MLEFIRKTSQECIPQSVFNELDIFLNNDDLPDRVVGKFKCVMNVINDAVKDTEFEIVWVELEKDMKTVEDHLKACESESSKWDEAEYVLTDDLNK